MGAFGHRRFSVAGHDRGSYVAERLSMDHPGSIRHLCLMEAIPSARRWPEETRGAAEPGVPAAPDAGRCRALRESGSVTECSQILIGLRPGQAATDFADIVSRYVVSERLLVNPSRVRQPPLRRLHRQSAPPERNPLVYIGIGTVVLIVIIVLVVLMLRRR
jgi:pimeloyl-ACP methyl ester carboxylesterase